MGNHNPENSESVGVETDHEKPLLSIVDNTDVYSDHTTTNDGNAPKVVYAEVLDATIPTDPQVEMGRNRSLPPARYVLASVGSLAACAVLAVTVIGRDGENTNPSRDLNPQEMACGPTSGSASGLGRITCGPGVNTIEPAEESKPDRDSSRDSSRSSRRKRSGQSKRGGTDGGAGSGREASASGTAGSDQSSTSRTTDRRSPTRDRSSSSGTGRKKPSSPRRPGPARPAGETQPAPSIPATPPVAPPEANTPAPAPATAASAPAAPQPPVANTAAPEANTPAPGSTTSNCPPGITCAAPEDNAP